MHAEAQNSSIRIQRKSENTVENTEKYFETYRITKSNALSIDRAINNRLLVGAAGS